MQLWRTPADEKSLPTVMEAINATGRGKEWFDIEYAIMILDNVPDITVSTVLSVCDYANPVKDVDDDGENIIECWREWEGRILWIKILTDYEDCVYITPVNYPGHRTELAESGLVLGKPTLAQLGL